MDLGGVCISMAVKDIRKSLTFYEALGFEKTNGDIGQNWLVLSNGSSKIGLFQGMFEDDLLAFTPSDARAIERALIDKGIEPETRTQGEEGPTHFTLKDPDGRTILVDQF